MKKIFAGFGVFFFWIIIWEALSLIVGQELLLPAPLQVLTVWFGLLKTGEFWTATGMSLLRILIGFAAAVVVGCLLAACTARIYVVRMFLSPILQLIRTAPVASFIILTFVWIQEDYIPAFIAFLMVVPLVWANVEEGIHRTDEKLLEMGRVYGLSGRTIWEKIRIPSLMPYLLTALQTGLGFAWKSGVAAEVICRPNLAIGDLLYQAKQYLATPEVFAWTLTVVLLSLCIEKGLVFLFKKFGKRYNVEGGTVK